jgi:membrane protease YdiL (CAAX protease family)
MDATGLANFSALPLFPLVALFWCLGKFSRREMGFVLRRWSDYGVAVLYPVVVMGGIALVAAAAGAVDLSQTDWRKAGINLALIAISTVLVSIVTEEGFFRGWLWASLIRAGKSPGTALIWTSAAFSLWHLSAVALPTGFNLPWTQIPVYMVNATLLGAVWGVLRWRSGSIVVAGVSHGLWNGLAYVLFGYSAKVGALGIAKTALFGPEVGLLGVVANGLFLTVILVAWKGPRDGDLAIGNRKVDTVGR